MNYRNGLNDWTTGLDYRTGPQDWITGLDYRTGLRDWTTGEHDNPSGKERSDIDMIFNFFETIHVIKVPV